MECEVRSVECSVWSAGRGVRLRSVDRKYEVLSAVCGTGAMGEERWRERKTEGERERGREMWKESKRERERERYGERGPATKRERERDL